MYILEKIEWNILNTYINNKLIKANKHPEYDIWILNYTPETQFNQCWDVYTMSCRGMVIDIEGNIISRCISKFFNIEEYKSEKIPNESFEVYDKIDGSYITMFLYNKEWIFASRGSFASDQAILAKKIFSDKYKNKVLLNENYNYIMELIGKDNKIVVDYPENDLILLVCFSVKDGNEISIYNENFNEFNRVKKYDGVKDYEILKSLIPDNAEGFVIKFKSGIRMKIKGTNYLRLHKILTNVSNIKIWEYLKNNGNFNELITNVPDEFYQWLQKVKISLQQAFNNIERLALKEFMEIYHVNNITDRKIFAMEALKSKYSSILFKLYDKKPYDELIWNIIKPVYSKPFRDGFEYGV
jgi:T4 RnlA family RNA ligase